MTTQPEALRLADWLDGSSNGPMDAKHKAAAELRRLHEANQELLQALKLIADVDLSGADDRSKAVIAEYLVHQANKAVIAKNGEKA